MKSNSKANSRRKVFAVVALNVYSGQRKLAGITRFFNERLPREEDKWDLDILHGHDALTDAAMRLAVREGVSGIILLDYPAEATVSLVARSGIPCVVETSNAKCRMQNAECRTHNAECRMQNVKSMDERKLVRIVCDARELAREAAQNLVVRQSFASFGYVGTPEGESWSRERGAFFQEALAARGRDCSVFNSRRSGLGAWLAALPHPAAICTANDQTARAVADAALAQDLRIPDDIAVLGIDDDPKFCLGTLPALSSVVQDFESCGYQAAEALQRLMDGDASGPDVLRYGAHGVSIRESTLSSSPHADFVQKALDWIDANACQYIGASDVARALGVSRRILDLRFRELLRTTVHAVLRERRLEEVKRLLADTDMSIGRITEQCGFTSAGHLKNLFRRTTGVSMRDWRDGRG
jgi:LacI family transcriptional regulator